MAPPTAPAIAGIVLEAKEFLVNKGVTSKRIFNKQEAAWVGNIAVVIVVEPCVVTISQIPSLHIPGAPPTTQYDPEGDIAPLKH